MSFRGLVVGVAFSLVPVAVFAQVDQQLQAVSEPSAESLRVASDTDGTGTASTIPKWVDSDTLGNSIMYQSGAAIGINTAAPFRHFTVDTPGATGGGMRVARTTATNDPYLDILLSTASTPYAYLQAGDGVAWRILSLNPSGGNVGIGTVSPIAKLHVAGTATTDTNVTVGVDVAAGPAVNYGYAGATYGRSAALINVRPDASATAPNPSIRLATADVPRVIITNTGQVGMGTMAPSAELHVVTSNANVLRGLLLDQITNDDNGYAMTMRKTRGTTGSPLAAVNGDSLGNLAASAYDGTQFVNGARIKFAADGTVAAGSVPTALQFHTGTAAFGAERMRITSSGNVGIGEANPTEKLVVNGNIVATGSITGATVVGSIYQDLAEWVPAAEDIPPGTVVVLNPDVENEVTASSRAYDTTVAGVVSSQPGIILGVRGHNKEQIATTGRVRVRVDATNAPIRVGDLLVSSDKRGVAMKSQPIDFNGRPMHQPGTIIGKALQPLASGEGEILVLLSLQ